MCYQKHRSLNLLRTTTSPHCHPRWILISNPFFPTILNPSCTQYQFIVIFVLAILSGSVPMCQLLLRTSQLIKCLPFVQLALIILQVTSSGIIGLPSIMSWQALAIKEARKLDPALEVSEVSTGKARCRNVKEHIYLRGKKSEHT